MAALTAGVLPHLATAQRQATKCGGGRVRERGVALRGATGRSGAAGRGRGAGQGPGLDAPAAPSPGAREKERARVLACGVRVWLGEPPRPLPWWQEVPGNYKSRHAGNIPLLLPGNVLCPALQEAPVRSQPGSQPVSQPASQPASLRPLQTPPPPQQQHKGRRGAGLRPGRALPSLLAAAQVGAWLRRGSRAAGIGRVPDPTAAGMDCAPASGWRSGWAKLCGVRWTAVRSPGAQGPRARGVLLRPRTREELPPGSVARGGEEAAETLGRRGQNGESGWDRPADHRRGHPRPSEKRSPGRSLEGKEKVKGFVCSCGQGPSVLPFPCLSAPPARLEAGGVGVGHFKEGQRVLLGPCAMCSSFALSAAF